MARKTSQAGIDFIKEWEGFSATAYDDGAGFLTIGYGHLITGKEPWLKGATITHEAGEDYLKKDLEDAEKWVHRKIKVALTQNQFDALVSHAFNTGGSDNLAILVNGAKQIIFKGKEYDLDTWWRQTYLTANGIKLRGLETRRGEEADIFFSGSYVANGKKIHQENTAYCANCDCDNCVNHKT